MPQSKPKKHPGNSKPVKGSQVIQNWRERKAAEAPSPNNHLSAQWKPFCLVLLVDNRSCGCGEKYVCPNPELMLEVVSRSGATRMVTVSRLDIHELTVPRILREVHTECHRCPKCFEPEPDGRPERPQVKFDGRSNLDASAFRRKGATKNVELSDFL